MKNSCTIGHHCGKPARFPKGEPMFCSQRCAARYGVACVQAERSEQPTVVLLPATATDGEEVILTASSVVSDDPR